MPEQDKQTAEDTLDLKSIVGDLASAVDATVQEPARAPAVHEVGEIIKVGRGYVLVSGLPNVEADEVLRFPGNRLGMAFNLDPDVIGVITLDDSDELEAGQRVERTGRVMDVPVGDALIGRVVDSTGRPLDGAGPIRERQRLPIERPAPGIIDRSPVSNPLQTGIKVVDALIPVGRGQRELILGDRQTGKTAIAVDAILNQRNFDVLCIYCAIGQRSSAIAGVVEDLRKGGAMDYTTVVVTTGDDPAALRFVAPYAAMSMGEYYMENGRDVLVVFDDLTRHGWSYRELSLLLRRPPGREAYPGDIFYVHSRLLERATHLKKERGGGSLTALPIVETQEQNISAYIPTNLISITDGQIFTSPELFQQGQLPAVDVGRSVSRVGGKAQLPAFREAASDLKLAYSQFQELERFSRYGTRLEEKQRRQLEHGRRVREVLKQVQYTLLSPAEQVAILLATSEGLLDDLPIGKVSEAEEAIRKIIMEKLPDIADRINTGEKLTDENRHKLVNAAREKIAKIAGEES